VRDWSPALLGAAIALLDLHFAEGGTNKAPVLELVVAPCTLRTTTSPPAGATSLSTLRPAWRFRICCDDR
jgi:hypothetical protein